MILNWTNLACNSLVNWLNKLPLWFDCCLYGHITTSKLHLQCLSDGKQAPKKKAVKFRLFVLLLKWNDRKKPSSKQLFYITFFSQGKQMMKLLNICIFPISIHPKPVSEWQGVAVPVTSLLLEKIRTLMAQQYCSFHSRSQTRCSPGEFFAITIFQVSSTVMITACVVVYFCSFFPVSKCVLCIYLHVHLFLFVCNFIWYICEW